MKNIILIASLIVTVMISGCKKSNETDYASAWIGVYNTSAKNQADPGLSASLNNIIITKIDGSTMKVQIKSLETGYIYTLSILKSVTLNSATTATIDETTTLTESTGMYHIKGTMTLSGGHVTLSATATPVGSTTETDVRTLSFSGDLNK